MKNNQTKNKDNKFLTITEAADINNVTRQAIYVAIKLNKLKATKDSARWTINLDDLERYSNEKYSRTKSVFNGELVFDNNKGYFSVAQIAKMLDVPAQHIYYATRNGYLKSHRKGAAWVVHMDDVKEYQQKHIQKKSKKAS